LCLPVLKADRREVIPKSEFQIPNSVHYPRPSIKSVVSGEDKKMNVFLPIDEKIEHDAAFR
jgi:hypothetical protein